MKRENKPLTIEKYFKIRHIQSEDAKAGRGCTGGCFDEYTCKLCGFKTSVPTCGIMPFNFNRATPEEHLELHILDKHLSKNNNN